MFVFAPHIARSFVVRRTFATKSNLKLLQQLRQETQVSITQAKEALVKFENDYDKALAWAVEQTKLSGLAKAEKLKGRVAKEGLVGVIVNNLNQTEPSGSLFASAKGAIVEVNCETDFVSRNPVFQNFVAQIASTLFFHSDVLSSSVSDHKKSIIQNVPVHLLHPTPLFPHPSSPSVKEFDTRTVQESIVELIGKLGENITLRRTAVVNSQGSQKNLLIDRYVHGGDSTTGKIGGLIVLQLSGDIIQKDHSSTVISKLTRNLARQVVGYNPKYINEEAAVCPQGVDREEFLNENVLLRQESLTGNGSVRDAIRQVEDEVGFQLKVLDFARWECGEGIEKQETDFASEVMQQAGLS